MNRKLAKEKILVVKIGSRVLVSEVGKIKLEVLRSLAQQISQLHEDGFLPLVVTSGAIACGNSLASAKTIIDEQVAASIGQRKLMSHWGEAFDRNGMEISQILCTHRDLHTRSTVTILRRSLELGIIPVINENDAVADEEILALHEHGDNDALAVIVAVTMEAARLILLTDVDGLYEGNPKINHGLEVIPEIEIIDDKVWGMAQRLDSDRPSGMASKIKAAKKATAAGITVHITNGNTPNVLLDIVKGLKIGTTFKPHPKP